MENWINAQVLQSVLRFLCDKIGILILAQGWASGEEWVTISGAFISLAIAVFSVISARMKHAALKVAASSVNPALANQIGTKAAIKETATSISG